MSQDILLSCHVYLMQVQVFLFIWFIENILIFIEITHNTNSVSPGRNRFILQVTELEIKVSWEITAI